MSPQIALYVYVVGVFLLLLLDRRNKQTSSDALWIPLVWFVILASRPIGTWFGDSGGLSVNVEDGSPIDRTFLLALMALAAIVLFRRDRSWSQWVGRNHWLCIFLLYCGMSVVWSDFPALAFKRWIRALGSIMMILVVLSESDPIAATASVVRRCGYILLPLSIVLIKYFRHVAVGYNVWTGQEFLVGVTTDKNALGRLCLVTGIFAVWELTASQRDRDSHGADLGSTGSIIILITAVWLLMQSKSATSLATFALCSTATIGLALPLARRNAKHLASLALITVFAAALVMWRFELAETMVNELGRNMTLTDRTEVWDALLNANTDPLIGVGYDSFWAGDRLERFVTKYQVNEAHNGYLEVYLELGLIGVGLLACLIATFFAKARRSLVTNFAHGRLRLVVLAMFLVYNVTEAGYKPTTLMFFVLLLVAIEPPLIRLPQAVVARTPARRSNPTAVPLGGAPSTSATPKRSLHL